jgi:phosphatidylcholine synthase
MSTSAVERIAAWSVHLFTASGAVLGLFALQAIARGEPLAALAWMMAAVIVDAVDGFFARLARVDSATPEYDGALLDNLVDFLNYAVVPAFFLLETGLIEGSAAPAAAALVVLASAYQFAHADAKTQDHFFRGFPSYWNVAVFYFHFGDAGPTANLAIVVVLGIASFVPWKWAYPTRMTRLRGVTLVLASLWGICLALVLRGGAAADLAFRASLGFVAYYILVSLYLSRRA